MTGEKEKKSSDLSTRLGVKRSGRLASKSSKSTSTISTPPKAAVASVKAKKEEVQRRKNPFNEMLLGKSGRDKDASSSTSTPPDENGRSFEHARPTSRGSLKNTHDTMMAERMAELEKALAATREEQDAMRDELEKVRQHGQVYRETIEDYRRQLSESYNQQIHSPSGAFNSSPQPQPPSPLSHRTSIDHEQETHPRQSFNRQRENLFEQNHELRSKIADLQDQLLSQDALYQSKPEQAPSKSEHEWNDLTARLHHSEKESQERLQQLLSLKSSISSLTRVDSQVTDGELSESFSQLANRVREWVISNYRRTKLDVTNIPPETVNALQAIHPRYENIDSSDRLALYQALIASALMSIFCAPVVVGRPDAGPLAAVKQLASYINDAGPAYREWCRTTIRTLEKSKARHALHDGKQQSLHELASEIEHQLFTLTSLNLTPNAQSTLLGILNTAADLQHGLVLQKAQYKVHFFRDQDGYGILFDEERMESINDLDDMTDDDGDVFTDRKVAFCVFPCLEKFGDEWGEHSDVSNVLLKARVCCGVG